MKLLKSLGRVIENKDEYMALFHCSYCNTEVVRHKSHGKKQKSCGCAKRELMKQSKKRSREKNKKAEKKDREVRRTDRPKPDKDGWSRVNEFMELV